MKDLVDDGQLLSLSRAAELDFLAAGGRAPPTSSLRRWALKGCGGVKLEIVYIGRTPYTTAAACRRFMRRRAELMQAGHAHPVARSKPVIGCALERRRQLAAATLDAIGIRLRSR